MAVKRRWHGWTKFAPAQASTRSRPGGRVRRLTLWQSFFPLHSLLALFLSGCILGVRQEVTIPATLPPIEASPTAASALTAISTSDGSADEPAVFVSTPGAEATTEPDIAATLVAGTTPRLYASYPSPDSALRAEVVIHDCMAAGGGQEYAYDILQVVEVANGETHFIDGQVQSCGGLGAFGLGGLFWSPSGRYFYYTDAREGVPDGCGFWTRPVNRVDTSNWTASDLGAGPVSPDGLLLAVWDERDLVVYEVGGDEVGRVEAAVSASALGPIAWSPDSRSLVYLQAQMFCIPGESGMTTVVRVDLPAMSERPLVQSTDPAFQSVTWEEQGSLSLGDERGEEWRYDLASRELSPAP